MPESSPQNVNPPPAHASDASGGGPRADRSADPRQTLRPSSVTDRLGRSPHPVFWVIAGALVVIAWQQVVRPSGSPAGVAMAQPTAGAGLRGVYSFSAELGRDRFGVYMVDVDTMTIWCYEYSREEGCLKLAAARSWKYDRYLESFNGCGISPDKVKELLDDQRAYRSESPPVP